MKKITLILTICLFSFLVNAQTMLVEDYELKMDDVYKACLNDYPPLADIFSKEISKSLLDGDTIRAKLIRKLRRSIWEDIRVFRNATVDTTWNDLEVDSLETINAINANNLEIERLKTLLENNDEGDPAVIQKEINKHTRKRNKANWRSKNWRPKNSAEIND